MRKKPVFCNKCLFNPDCFNISCIKLLATLHNNDQVFLSIAYISRPSNFACVKRNNKSIVCNKTAIEW